MRTWPALEIQRANADTCDLILAFLTDFNVAAIDDNNPDVSVVYFHDSTERDRTTSAFAHAFPSVAVRDIDVPDEDWAARSQASLHAIQVANIIVAPPWDVPAGIRPAPSAVEGDSGLGIRSVEPIVIVIQPSMGFGTGHHATTRLCLAALQQIDLRGLRVIDVGTGSGVLAIAASRLGAGDVVAVDDDPDAVASARENFALNPDVRVALTVFDVRMPTPESRILSPPRLRSGQAESRIPDRFDVVVANLTGGLLIAAAARLTSLAAPSGRLVLSGLMDSEEDDVLRAFGRSKAERRAQEGEWICLEFAPDRK
jgi:ribosomal protein L11 methyltransferase